MTKFTRFDVRNKKKGRQKKKSLERDKRMAPVPAAKTREEKHYNPASQMNTERVLQDEM